MIRLRKSTDRGHANHGWLDSYHSFSFAGYNDPAHVHWGPLRVINEDRVEAGHGFGRHGHRDMEIISYVLSGALGHGDSMGTASRIVPGDVQRMSAGSGVEHSEFNHETGAQTHFLQIWIIPEQPGGAPSYEQKHFTDADKRGCLRLIVSADGRDGSVRIGQQASVFAGLFDGAERAEHVLAPDRLGYVHVARGRVVANGHALEAGDALLYEGEPAITLAEGEGAEVLVFDLPRR
jgi:quercetin 2,3-dioxygenase